jgi:iron complex outermembrane receptor protein
VDFADGPKFILKDAATFTVDFKATKRIVLSLNALYTYAEGEYWNRDFVFIATGRNTVGGDGLTRLNTLPSGATPTGQLSNQGGSAEKLTYTRTLSPKFQYKLDNWTVDGSFTYSISENNYEALERGRTNNEGGAVTGDWTATRPNSGSQEWTFRQTSGPDWYNLANFTGSGTRVNSSDRYYITELWSGQLGAKWVLPFRRIPTSIKFGGKWTEENRRNRNSDAYNVWSYIGPGGNVLTGYDPITRVPNIVLSGNWANLGYVSPTLLDMGTSGALTMYNLGGVEGMAPRANHYSIANLFRDHPEQFVLTATPDNYYTAYIANTRNFRQTVNAAYGMVDTRPTSRLSLRFGLRRENTETQSREFNPRLRADLLAAGYPVAATGRATTVAGLNYQYFSKPRVTRRSEYDNWFPSALGKYRIGENIELQAGFNQAISRPPIDSISGVYSISESTRVVTVPNVNLQPEYSNNYQARVAYYFAPGSQLTVGASQNDIRNFRISSDLSAADFGNEDPELAAYIFRTTANSPESRRFRAMDVGYDQTLSFLPEILRGTSIGFTYSRTYANLRYVNTAPHRGSGKLGYAYKRFNGALRMVWATDRPISNVGRYLRHSASYDLSATLKLTSHLSLYVQGRNIFDQPYRSFESPPGAVEGQSGALYQYQQYGANWVFGLKGVF